MFSGYARLGWRWIKSNPQRGRNILAWTIFGVNTSVFAAWKAVEHHKPLQFELGKWSTLRHHPLWKSIQAHDQAFYRTRMSQHFTLSLDNITEGRWWTILSSGFSHQQTWHFALNMLAIVPMLHDGVYLGLSASRTLGIYLGSILFGSGATLLTSYVQHTSYGKTIAKERSELPLSAYVGASGGGFGLLSHVIAREPQSTFGWGALRVPAWAFLAGTCFVSGYGLRKEMCREPAVFGHSGHLGGMLFGLICRS